MQQKTLYNRLLAVCFIAVGFATSLHAQNNSDNNNAVRIERNETTHLPKSIVFSSPVYKLHQVDDVFNRYLSLDALNTLQLVSTQTPPEGLTVQRYTQWYQGIRVANSSVTVSAKGDVISFLTANVYKPDQTLSTVPAITETVALTKALDFVSAQKYMWQDAKAEGLLKKITKNNDTSYFPKGTLVWIEDRSNGQRDGQLHLAYCFNIYAKEPLRRDLIYVDAQNGKVIFRNSLLKHTAATGASLYSGTVGFETIYSTSNSQYVLHDLTRGSGIFTYSYNNGTSNTSLYDFINPSTYWGPADQAIDAHWGAKNVFDYWFNVQNRYSIDGYGMTMNSAVNYDIDYDNAFWDGSMMNYGDGSGVSNGGFSPLTSMDVCAHEIGHGICQYTADLDYYAESGAINESLSDIWGAVIENWSNPHETDAQAKETWEMGEEIGATPMRSMDAPKQHGQPDTYGGTNWVDVNTCNPSYDQCGVHTNSGVGNHWFYLLSQGGSGINDLNHSFYVNGIGITKAAKIVYQTECAMGAYDEYADFRNTSILTAVALYGTCSPEVEAVTRAWYAVGVGGNFVPCTPQVSFANAVTMIDENANSTACPSSRTVNIPLVLEGPAITGGTATVTVSVVNAGTAVNGVDYTLGNNSFSFGPTSPVTQNVLLTIYDNGSVDTDKSFVLGYTVNANGSNLTAGYVHRDSIIIVSDDKIPEPGGDETMTVGIGAPATSNFTSPFAGGAKTAHTEYIITAAEMLAAGIKPNAPIKSLAFNVTQKNSTIPYNSYTIKMKNTTQTANDLMSGFMTGSFGTVYSGTFTTSIGWNTLNFLNNFTWDGVSNVGVMICFNNSTYGNSNDQVAAVNTGSTVTAYASAWSGSGACSLPYDGDVSTARPLFRFVQSIPPTPIETTVNSDRSWDVHAGQNVYFYSAQDNQLIAGIDSVSADLGCTIANVKIGGNGFYVTNIAGTAVNRSVKEFTITPTLGGGAVDYGGTFFFKNSELNGTVPASLWLVKTDAATDGGINASNTAFVTPQLVQGQNYVGFRGSFTGFARYFLVDKNPLGVNNPEWEHNNIQVKNNPFDDVIHIGYSYQSADNAKISLTDISGKTLFKSEQRMNAGNNTLDIDLSQLSLAPGYYMLQVVTSKEVFVQKMLH